MLMVSCGDDGPTNPVDPPDETSQPSAPGLVAPENSASNLPSIVNLRWSEVDDADTYHVQVSKTSDFSSLVLNVSDLSKTSLMASELDLDSEYYWRVRSVNTDGSSSWSNIWSFSVEQLLRVSNDTQIVDEELSDMITDTSAGLESITFTGESDFIENLETGKILLAASSDNLPNGALKKITDISKTGNTTTVVTVNATLEEAIEEADIEIEIPISPEQVEKEKIFFEGVQLNRAKSNNTAGEFYFGLNDVVIYDDDDNLETKSDQISVNGNIVIRPTLKGTIKIKNFKIETFEFFVESSFNSELNLSSGIDFEYIKEKLLAEYNIGPITVGYVVLKPRIELYAGFEGKVSAGLTTGINYQSDLTAGLGLSAGEWETTSGFEQNIGFTPIEANVDASAKVYSEVKIINLLYGLAGPYATLQGYLEGNVALLSTPWWSLYWGLEAGVGARVEVLSRELVDVDYPTVIGYRNLLAEADTDNIPIVTIEPVDQITTSSATITGKVERESGTSPVTERGVCWSMNNNPTTGDDCNQEGSGEGTFTSTISGLNSGTQYYVRSYAINNVGTAYSNEEVFTTEAGLSLATVTTNEISSITSNTAQSGGNVTDDGGANVTDRGVCWSTSQDPTLNDSCTNDGSGVGEFISTISDLTAETEYFVRAYATNDQGTGYGEERNFITESESGNGDWPRDTTTEVVDVYNPATGQTWMDRNMGASRAATSPTDEEAYGDLYQWGRPADGHQKRKSGTTSTLSSTDTPGHGDFITSSSGANYDWRSPQNDNLWQGVNGVNNPCPDGYRLPTEAEWETERQSWSNNNSAGAFESPLKLTLAGYHSGNSGSLNFVDSSGNYWSSSVSGTDSRSLYFGSSDASMYNNLRANGFPVRCIKD